ncbi:MAG: hypothetical protein HC763_20550 [Hydrococcus sp. CRU_1_1]|nr:hypothetical protein [Hydrococcus sp. CRU_1_1]
MPFLVWLLENPDSPLPLPAKISLKNHDYVHVILDLDLSCQSEAFIVGFTMGNDSQTNEFFINFFKFVARFLYPGKYRFSSEDLQYFEEGLIFGRELPSKNLNSYIFESLQEDSLEKIREKLKINFNKLKQLLNF